MENPFFSIITPCYQPGERLAATVQSVLSQRFGDFEMIIKDAGSLDGSLETIPADHRIRVIQCKDGGIYDGMNQAVASARGEFLYFLNCGDLLHDADVLADTVDCIQREWDGSSRPVIYYGDVWEKRTGQRAAAKPAMTHFAMYRNLPCHQACFYSRDLFEERQFDLRYRVRADYEHFLWCVLQAGAQTHAMNRIVADYEGGGFSETKENRKCSAREHREITERYLGKGECLCYRLAMLVSLQPLRAKISSSPATAAFYDKVKNRVYRK